jgi:hypothetical protein
MDIADETACREFYLVSVGTKSWARLGAEPSSAVPGRASAASCSDICGCDRLGVDAVAAVGAALCLKHSAARS